MGSDPTRAALSVAVPDRAQRPEDGSSSGPSRFSGAQRPSRLRTWHPPSDSQRFSSTIRLIWSRFSAGGVYEVKIFFSPAKYSLMRCAGSVTSLRYSSSSFAMRSRAAVPADRHVPLVDAQRHTEHRHTALGHERPQLGHPALQRGLVREVSFGGSTQDGALVGADLVG